MNLVKKYLLQVLDDRYAHNYGIVACFEDT